MKKGKRYVGLVVLGIVFAVVGWALVNNAPVNHRVQSDLPVAPMAFAQVLPALWGWKKIAESKSYPVVGVTSTHTSAERTFDLKERVGDGVLTEAFLRVVGTIVAAGAGVGAASGIENPEGLVEEIYLKLKPDHGVICKNRLTARASISQEIFDIGNSIRETDITDAAGNKAIDFAIPLRFAEYRAAAPIEHALPMAFFKEATLKVKCGGRQRLFTGGTNTYDFSGLNMEVWGIVEEGVQIPAFHLKEEFEEVVDVTASKKDRTIDLEPGYVYESILLLAERDNVLVDDIVNDVALISGGRAWVLRGDDNVKTLGGMTRKWNRRMAVASETLTGLYNFPLMRNGMISRAPDAVKNGLQLILDVTRTSGVENVTMRVRRFKPQFLQMAKTA
ncbi:MAG: hypothetical protein A4C66_10790 [Nitrospira sp. HN-bin3]|uniref:hypothetical protein n=1 Tax=Nitrospira cf. moscoviensis SBR1015 TaxID=96242 RepID=UPI000A0AEF9C|nr:hypothetical protein [Nitrospira cf. moscoviensis SBR1015]OQW40313.1 MAG: hypothetical protein A4C66_10790 [Nitrospira sp. HN-bin3]